MITDAAIAQLCAAIYAGAAAFDYYDAGEGDGVVWGLKALDVPNRKVFAVILRGSVALMDWLRDLDFWQDPLAPAPMTADAYPGFDLGMANMWIELRQMIPADAAVIVGGHSLGAARARNLAARMVRSSRPPLACITFGEPKPGGPALAALSAEVAGRSYRNGDPERHAHDLVTDVPFTGKHDRPATDIYARPAFADLIDPFAFHHIALYAGATPDTVIIG